MRDGLISDLSHILGSGKVSSHTDDLSRYSGDALGVYRAFRASKRLYAEAAVVVWPESTQDVSTLLKYAQSKAVPVVPYGGGTGVMGAATPIEDGIILNLQRMNSIVNISKIDLTATFQPGVVLEDASTALGQNGLLLGHDPWSRPIATVAGAISTNGMGYTAAKHGSMGEQVLGLEAVLADGEIIKTRAVPKQSYGPSLNHLLIGAEGTFGVITEATIRAFPEPEARIIRAIDFPDFDSGFHAVAALYAEGVRPAMIDYGVEMWPEQANDEDDATLYIAFEGFREDVETQLKRTMQICARYKGKAGDQTEAQTFWNDRHSSGENYKKNVLLSDNPGEARKNRTSYRMDYLHVALPVSTVLNYRDSCRKIFEGHHVLVREWSLWAKPEFFSFLIVHDEDRQSETSEEMGDVVDSVLTLAQEMGGTMEYCHGVGVKLAHLMQSEHGNGMNVIRKMKKAIDPNNILNRGKLV